MKAKRCAAGVALACALAAPASHASISLGATRVIFDGKDKEASVAVSNDGADALIQSWLDPLDDASTEPLPFAITPPLAKLGAKQQQLLRVLYEGVGRPVDRESAFWLNVQEIPQQAHGENVLQLAVRQRIKVFYRPAGLSGDPQRAPDELQWKLTEDGGKATLHVTNPSLYHVTVVDAKVRAGTGDAPVADARMIAPRSTLEWPVRMPPARTLAPELRYDVINDYGGRQSYRVTLRGADSGKPIAVDH
ncbi:chaperone protein EcpD [Burkholderia latens]|uniref:fimbrial biogenesis chaperone n=1 Tax=Burkholderia TaxID=32008 RepID=UPI000841C89A|nr:MULTISPECIES: molecular chaperone [Burkholderia]AOK06914.1 pilus assembly protein [Burkholderia latens]MBY4696570.1 molecular chaperone [Burkholderia latens]MCA8312423.1 molecular chaperone [Burkholderia sp. AU28942]QTO51568.1 molecular chaperone [Burkholderia latens]